MTVLGIFGEITNPFIDLAPGTDLASSDSGQGLIILLSNLVRLSIVLAGVYTLFNIILAGYGFISAGGDAKLVQKSTERIWRSVLGLLIVASSVLIAGIIGWLVFRDTTALITPRIWEP